MIGMAWLLVATAPAKLQRKGRNSMHKERKDAARRAMAVKPVMGVYAVRETAAGTVRIGSSENIPAAWNRLRLQLDMGNHPDAALQALWKSGGAGAVAFEVLDELKPKDDAKYDPYDDIVELDRMWMEKLGAGATHLPFSLPRKQG